MVGFKSPVSPRSGSLYTKNAQRTAIARQLVAMPHTNPVALAQVADFMRRPVAIDLKRCPHCQHERLRVVEQCGADRELPDRLAPLAFRDRRDGPAPQRIERHRKGINARSGSALGPLAKESRSAKKSGTRISGANPNPNPDRGARPPESLRRSPTLIRYCQRISLNHTHSLAPPECWFSRKGLSNAMRYRGFDKRLGWLLIYTIF
jgi:hypothetical protein